MFKSITLLIVCHLVYVPAVFGNIVDEGLKKLSHEDRVCMKVFFNQAIKQHQAGHVFFSNHKPVCIICCALKYKDKVFNDVLALRGWQAFKKNENSFPHPNFIFNEILFEASQDCKILHIYAINKNALRTCLSKYDLLFKQVLGAGFSPDIFIAELEKGHSLLSLIDHDEMLLGVLLGYGEESSRAFKEVRKKCTETYAPPPTETYCRIALSCPYGCTILPVVFMGNPHSQEVHELRSLYEKELETIWETYKRLKNNLKPILDRVCSE